MLLLEAGSGDLADPDVGSLAATAPGHPRNWTHPVELAPGLPAVVPRGRGVGGSGAINAAVWTYVTPADAQDWSVPGWSYRSMRYWYAIAEREPIYATDGPVPVQVATGPLLHPSTERFLAAAAALGFAEEPDKNAGGPPGAGPGAEQQPRRPADRPGPRLPVPPRSCRGTSDRRWRPPRASAESRRQRVWYSGLGVGARRADGGARAAAPRAMRGRKVAAAVAAAARGAAPSGGWPAVPPVGRGADDGAGAAGGAADGAWRRRW